MGTDLKWFPVFSHPVKGLPVKMKFKKTVIFGLVCLITICSARPADEDYADYAEPAPPPKAPARHSPLLNRRNPLTRGATAKATTTTTTPAPVEEESEEVPEEEVEEVPEEQPSSTTEAPKRLRGGIVRPFRSNDDLLAALKRRREQAASQKSQSKTTPAPVADESAPAEPAPSKSRPAAGKRRFTSSKNDAAPQEQNQEQPATAGARTGRRFSARS